MDNILLLVAVIVIIALFFIFNSSNSSNSPGGYQPNLSGNYSSNSSNPSNLYNSYNSYIPDKASLIKDALESISYRSLQQDNNVEAYPKKKFATKKCNEGGKLTAVEDSCEYPKTVQEKLAFGRTIEKIIIENKPPIFECEIPNSVLNDQICYSCENGYKFNSYNKKCTRI